MSVGAIAIAGVVIMDERAGQDAGNGRVGGRGSRDVFPQSVVGRSA